MIKKPPFDLQQPSLGLPGVATDAGSRNHTMTGYEKRPGIFPAGAAYRPWTGIENFCQLRITDSLSNRYAEQLPPDPFSEFRTLA